ncbi:class I SAM-dependent rRNA methyltransferase [Chitinivorax sp. B]|uniref:class I SAM-dependent rRNA methyltransferase n=1 Tax=Chitinivorax sp. B TaxID=2502235 RepID=UPI0010F9CF20|nr:class I SAM-dependent rRNA methyltransferase [Chitinivorax sp. B]
MTFILKLKPGREKSLLNRHPWVFSGAVQQLDGEPQAGDTVLVRSADGRFLGNAAYSPHSQIRARVWSVVEGEPIDANFFRRRLQTALALRRDLLPASLNGQRLVHGESDGLPGLVVDRYDQVLVVQVLSIGVERWREVIVDALVELTGIPNVYERSDADVRGLEGLPERCGLLRGNLPADTMIDEYGVRYRVDIAGGQKTGFYLDQRVNRRRIGELAAGKKVLNCFCYTGGFSLAALRGGALSVESVDSSAEALATAQANLVLNNLDPAQASWVEADVFKYLRLLRDKGQSYDLIILDPPKFAPTAQHVEKAARAYKDINLLGLKLLKPGGLLATFTCSGGMDASLFQKIIAGAAVDAGLDAKVIERFTPDVDHPVALSFPEGDYLKGLLVKRGL